MDDKRRSDERDTAYKANIATINAAASAKRSADATKVSASAADRSANIAKQALIISIIVVLLSLASF